MSAVPPLRHPYLVQRVSYAHDGSPDQKGVDTFFSFDYMGSSEFEFNALPKALKLMRANRSRYLTEPRKIKLGDGKVAWYVGPDDDERIALVQEFFEDQVSGQLKIPLKERSYIEEAYANKRYSPEAWWAIDRGLPWLLFKKEEHARVWIEVCWP